MTVPDKKSSVINASIKLFSHYGVKKTSMAAIAEEAGLSRQTVYSLFPSKDDMVLAAMHIVLDEIKKELRLGWQECDSVESIVDVYFERAVLRAHQLISKSPDLKDLIYGTGSRTKELAEKAEAEKIALLAGQLQQHNDVLTRNGTNAKRLSKYIVKTTTELKFSVSNKKELSELLATLKTTVLAVSR